MSKKTILIIVGIIAAVVGFLVFTKPAENNNETASQPSNHVWTEGSTGVVFVEYGDFQCPACASYYPAIKEIKEKYDGLVTFQFRNFPLESLHKNARAASRAAEAAHMQGKFWEMHDYLYENQTAWEGSNDPISIFIGYAQAIGIGDIAKFETDIRGSEVNGIISADLNEGRALGATSTPTFILNGKKLEENPASSADAISVILDRAIEEKTGQKPVFNNNSATPAEESETE